MSWFWFGKRGRKLPPRSSHVTWAAASTSQQTLITQARWLGDMPVRPLPETPPVQGPLLGWRLWTVTQFPEGWRLGGWAMCQFAWPAGERMLGVCTKQLHPPMVKAPRGTMQWDLEPPLHRVPAQGCGCGLYGYRTGERAVSSLRNDAGSTLVSQLRFRTWQAERHYEDAPRVLNRFVDEAVFVMGRVSGWGETVMHRDGWRTQFAYPYALQVVSFEPKPLVARALRDAYKVDVVETPAAELGLGRAALLQAMVEHVQLYGRHL